MSDPKKFNNPQRKSLNEADVGDVGMAVLTLAKEVWLLRDRMAVLEAVLADQGMDVTTLVNNYQPNKEMQEKLDAQASELVEAVLGAIKGQ